MSESYVIGSSDVIAENGSAREPLVQPGPRGEQIGTAMAGKILGVEHRRASLYREWSKFHGRSADVDAVLLAWAAAARAAHLDRKELVRVICNFLFGKTGENGAMRMCVKKASGDGSTGSPDADARGKHAVYLHQGTTDKWKMTEMRRDDLVLPLFKEAYDGNVQIDLERGGHQALFDLCFAYANGNLESSIQLPFSFSLALTVERVFVLIFALGQHDLGRQMLVLLQQLLPDTVKLLSPLAHADMVHENNWVRYRSALQWDMIQELYPSVAEYERIRSCLIDVYDLSGNRLAAIIHLKDDVIEVAMYMHAGRPVYEPSEDMPAVELVPLVFSGSGVYNVHVKEFRLGIPELGCASIALPPLWLRIDHQADCPGETGGPNTFTDASAVFGHTWSTRITEVQSAGRVFEAILRPFINMPAYRKALCESFRIEIAAKASPDDVRIRVSLPLPSISKALCMFLNWWLKRQLQALDELRLITDICEAIAKDIRSVSIQNCGGAISSFVTCGSVYHDAQSTADDEGPRNTWRSSCWLKRFLCCRRKKCIVDQPLV